MVGRLGGHKFTKINSNGIDLYKYILYGSIWLIVLEKAESRLKNLLIAIAILSLEDEAMHYVRVNEIKLRVHQNLYYV